jgi:hypothetical protein
MSPFGRSSKMPPSTLGHTKRPAVDIPIYLEVHDDRHAARSYGTTPTTPTTPERLSRDRSTHNSVATTIQTSSVRSVVWPIPEPPPEIEIQQPRRPLLRFFPSDRPRVRLDSATTPYPSESEKRFSDKDPIKLGLGIVEGPRTSGQYWLPSPVSEKPGRSPNLAQRIEEKMFQFNGSQNVFKRWLLEVISWSISAICMAAIVAVLIYLQDKPLPRWPLSRIGLTLNAYIAILSKIAGAGLILPVSESLGQLKWSWFQRDSKKLWDFEIFDNASRGPWGSFLLLIRTKFKTLAALGAVITIFALALDPFFQQLVSFPDRWVLQAQNSSIPIVVQYNPVVPKEFRAGVEILQGNIDMSATLDKFFYDNGTQPQAFGNGTRADIPLSCPTSNCTWPEYETLGFCNKCADVSTLLEFACLDTKIDWTANLLGSGYEDKYPNGTVCGYFLNVTDDSRVMMSGYLKESVNSSAGTGEEGEVLLSRSLPLVTNPDRTPLYGNGSINFKHVRNPIVDVIIVTAANGTESVRQHQRPVALECVVSWCVKTIQSSYWLAAYEEKVVKETYNETAGPFPWLTVPFVSETLNGTDIYYTQDISIQSERTGTVFGVSNATASLEVAIFDDVFPSFTTITKGAEKATMREKFYVGPKGPMTRILDRNPWLYPNDLHSHMDRMSTAISNVIRSATGTEAVLGKSYIMENYVSVRWEWSSLPLGLLFLSLIFLTATVMKTSREEGRVSVWKTSAIATLLYGLPDDMKGKITKETKTDSPRSKAKKLKVKLHPSQGWRISHSNTMFSPLTPKPKQNLPPPGWL